MVGGFNLIGFNSNMDELASQNPFAVKRTVDYNEELKSVIVNNKIDAKFLQNEIFPIKSADIFISHSHGDEELALGLKSWLKKELGMTSFLDGEIWGSANATLKEIDKFCWKKERNCYDYNERNLTTSYVHVMLCNALTQVMDKCKFVFFLNTPNSITPKTAWGESITHSPWLFYELSVLKYIQKRDISAHIDFARSQESIDLRRLMNYSVDLADLPNLKIEDLKELKSLELIKRFETMANYFETVDTSIKKRIL